MHIEPNDFIIQYPGVYEGAAGKAMEQYLDMVRQVNESGPVDVRALVAGELQGPHIGPVLKVTEAMVRYNNDKYDPENPVLNDAEYARMLGYCDIPAFPAYGAHDDTYTVPTPPEARDTLLVSQINHSVTSLAPVYPGDTLYLVKDRIDIIDMTPTEGSVYRHLLQKNWGTIYNQRGEVVNKVLFTLMESVKCYKEGRSPKPKAQMGFADIWEAPEWTARPLHYYTDEDWERIREIWTNEEQQGSTPLFWEDVRIGDRPALTADGPILEGLIPSTPYGMGIGGSRTLKKQILDPELFATLIRDGRNGNYRSPDPQVNVPPVPDGAAPGFIAPPDEPEGSIDTADIHGTAQGGIDTADIHKASEDRSALINFMGRDFAIRHINNWMGDRGQIRNIKWSIMSPDVHAAMGKPVPVNPEYTVYTRNVPGMEGSTIEAHGLSNDLAIVNSCVTEKFVCNNEFLAKLTFWIEAITGEIWLTGEATVKLPSKRVE